MFSLINRGARKYCAGVKIFARLPLPVPVPAHRQGLNVDRDATVDDAFAISVPAEQHPVVAKEKNIGSGIEDRDRIVDH